MYQTLDLFRLSGDMARHAGRRQAIVAVNLANADTPGYVARQLGTFADSYREGATAALRATRPGHLGGSGGASDPRPTVTTAEPSPNGNAVSLEQEMLNAVDAQREHSRALAIYRHAMTVIRTSLGR